MASGKSCISNQSNYEPSMSKWTGHVSTRLMVALVVVIAICVLPTAIEAKSLYGEETAAAAAHVAGALEHERQQQSNGMADLMDYGTGGRDDGAYEGSVAVPVDNPLLNYLYSRQMLQRLRPSAFVDQPYYASYLSPAQQQQQLDGIRKRTSTYWKQCAFNAVSCFGRK